MVSCITMSFTHLRWIVIEQNITKHNGAEMGLLCIVHGSRNPPFCTLCLALILQQKISACFPVDLRCILYLVPNHLKLIHL